MIIGADLKELTATIKAGYAITSCALNGASRIDRSDWKEHMAKQHAPWDPTGDGMDWVNCLGNRAADHYRRAYSKDNISIPGPWMRYMPRSGDCATGFCQKAYNKSNDTAQKEILMDILKE